MTEVWSVMSSPLLDENSKYKRDLSDDVRRWKAWVRQRSMSESNVEKYHTIYSSWPNSSFGEYNLDV